MNTAPTASHQALLHHLLSRLTSDLDFLESQALLSKGDNDLIKSKLPTAASLSSARGNDAGVAIVEVREELEKLNEVEVRGPAESDARVGNLRTGASGSSGAARRVVAVWDYEQTQPDDLPFHKGDIISLQEEMNSDWWKGSCNGRVGIFPSNHVEAAAPAPVGPPLPARSPQPLRSNMKHSPTPSSSSFNAYHNQSQQQPYHQAPQTYNNSFSSQSQNPNSYLAPSPYGAMNEAPQPQSQHSYFPPPPPPQQYQDSPNNNNTASPNPPPVVGQSGEAPPIPKKPGLGKFGKSMAGTFARGAGFGAGFAVASDVVNAIL